MSPFKAIALALALSQEAQAFQLGAPALTASRPALASSSRLASSRKHSIAAVLSEPVLSEPVVEEEKKVSPGVAYVLPTSNTANGLTTSGTVSEQDGYLAVQASSQMQYNYNFVNDIWSTDNPQMADMYREYGRCLVVMDTRLDALYGEKMEAYFEHHGLPLTKAVFPIGENTKTMRTLESMIDAMQAFGLNRQEPVLLMGGGLITDVGGFACSMLRRNTPYVRVPTSLIGLIDASIAIKVAVNHADGKNKLGAFHSHEAVYLDTAFLATLPAKELRVGMAEIIKITTVEEERGFEILEKHCENLMETKFGWVNPDNKFTEEQMSEIKEAGGDLLYRAIHRMLELETPNLQELNLDRAIAFGHTWSPEVELQAKYKYGKLIMHGQAVAMDMALSMTLAARRGLVSEADRDRVHSVISRVGLMLDHPAHWESDVMEAASREITMTRNGKLRAAVPIEKLGQCTFLNDVEHEELMAALAEHTEICKSNYPREGRGLDYWIEEEVASEERFVVTPTDRLLNTLDAATLGRTYKEVQAHVDAASDFVKSTDAMVAKYSSQPSDALRAITEQTASTNAVWAELAEEGKTQMQMEAEMISGQAEAQLLKLLVQFGKANRVLDVGTFTGYSALAMAEALPEDGKVVTLEREQSAADMARAHFAASPNGAKVTSLVNEAGASDELVKLSEAGEEAFDLVFVDADKPGYMDYYNKVMDSGLLKVGGLLVVDNSMYKGEEQAGVELSEAGAAVKAVNEAILADERVEQVMLPLRDGVTLVYRKA